MLNLLSQIDFPVVLAFLVAGAGFLYAHGFLKGGGIASLAKGLADQAVQHALMDATGILDGITPQNASDRIDGWVWAELKKHGIAKNDGIDMLVKPAIASAVSRVLEGLRAKLTDAATPTPAALAIAVAKTPQAGFAKLSLLVILATVAGLFMFASCGASQRQKAIAATYASIVAADTELLAYSKQHEADILTKAPNETQGQASLVDFRAKVDDAEKTLDAGYRSVAAASIADNDQSLAALLKVWAIASAELHDLGVIK